MTMTAVPRMIGNEVLWYFNNTAADDESQRLPRATAQVLPGTTVNFGNVAYQTPQGGPLTELPHKTTINYGSITITCLLDPTSDILAQLRVAAHDDVTHTLTSKIPARFGTNAAHKSYSVQPGTITESGDFGEAVTVEQEFMIEPVEQPYTNALPGTLELSIAGTSSVTYELDHYFYSPQDAVASYDVDTSDNTKATINTPTPTAPGLTITGVAAGPSDVTVVAVTAGGRRSVTQTITVTVSA